MDDSLPVRPTSDKAREAVFSSIQDRVPGAIFLDIFAGTGAIGLEALSRGADRVLAIEQSARVVRLLKKNKDLCGVGDDRLDIVVADFTRALPRLKDMQFDVIFADPPYHRGFPLLVLELVAELELLHPQGVLVIEHFQKEALPERQASLVRIREKKYGQTIMSYYHRV
jgi:16S rRNA (guanine(966)-N(2))-methyltransferase RsmD